MRTVRFYFGQAVFVEALVRDLLEWGIIGGATITTGRGFWLGPSGRLDAEDCQILVTTYEDDDHLWTLRGNALGAARKAGEESVMVELPDGTVDFMETGIRKDELVPA